MPELPEVETIRRALEPHLYGRHITAVAIREPRLRWPVPADLADLIGGKKILTLERRGKYLLLKTDRGTLIVHLGMSGSLRLTPSWEAGRHDHVVLCLDGASYLIFHDPRRFGTLLWSETPQRHPLLRHLGVDPFDPRFGGEFLHRAARGCRRVVKSFLMDQRIVAGVGNIYANESLFAAAIHPARTAGRISRARYEILARSLRRILADAIDQGGTTLRDFTDAKGRPGYFQLALKVYGRENQPCSRCDTPIRRSIQGQRATFHCPRCQR